MTYQQSTDEVDLPLPVDSDGPTNAAEEVKTMQDLFAEGAEAENLNAPPYALTLPEIEEILESLKKRQEKGDVLSSDDIDRRARLEKLKTDLESKAAESNV